MGLLDTPLISEMDEIENKARKGDDAALEMLFNTLSPMRRMHVERLMRNEGKTMRDALEKAGLLICIR